MYLCDTWLWCIYAYDFDRGVGLARNRRVFAALAPEDGYPDGVDRGRGGLCLERALRRLAHHALCTGRAHRHSGATCPVQHVTSLTFGGADLRTLFVTSAWLRLTPDARERQPLAGHVIAFEPGVGAARAPCLGG